jgi:hypothetical protein
MEELMSRILLTAAVAALVLCAGPAAHADDQGKDWQQQLQFGLDDLGALMQRMDDMLQSIPRFEAPIIDENGDIIIRRAPRERGFDPFTRPDEPGFADI